MYLAFTLSVVFYMFLHSFLAHNKVKSIIYNKFMSERYYRLFFIFYAITFLMPIAYFYFTSNKTVYFKPDLYIYLISIILTIISLYIFYISFKNYDFKEFLGLDRLQSANKIHYQLNTDGINKHVRHPLYSASYLLMAGVFLFSPDNYVLTACIIIAIYLPIGIIYEEKKLIEEYGEKYIYYMQEVPMLIPKIKNYLKK